MARKHARLLLKIWEDGDFLALTSSQQITYLALLSSRDLSWCGVAPLIPRRLAKISSDMTERKAVANLDALRSARFIVIDEDTAEVAVRSYVRHDEFMGQPNVVKAMIKALEKVHSDALRSVVVDELSRYYLEEPDLNGWGTVSSMAPELFGELQENGWGMAS